MFFFKSKPKPKSKLDKAPIKVNSSESKEVSLASIENANFWPQSKSEGEKGLTEAAEGQKKSVVMDFYGHLGELRRRIIACLICLLAATIVAWNFAESIVKFILSPVLKFLPPDQGLVYTGLTDAFSVTFRLSLWAGAVVSAPYFFYQIWAFVAPGLHPEEKAKVPFLTILATALLLLGACFAYFAAFPMTFKFFLAFSSEEMRPLLAVDRYMSLCMGLIVAFAVAFQLPLVLMFLARLGLVTPEFLKKSRSYAVVLIFIVAAILTPPDVVSQILLAAALIFLYELSIFLIKRQNIALARAQILAEKEADSDLD